ncbi:hypothetical protein PRNP1_012608 [Phytophthora ramorum]
MNPNSKEWFFSAACARQALPTSTPPRPGLQPDPVPQPSPARHPIPPAVASPSSSSSSSSSPSILDIYDGAPMADEPMTDAPPTPGQPAYRLFGEEELDIDYLEVTGPCVVLPYLSKLTFGLGSSVREHKNMLLVAQGPGYVYVDKAFKIAILVQLGVHFGYPFEGSDDERGLLKWQRRRLSGYDLALVLLSAGVNFVIYIDYGMKGKLLGFSWIDEMLAAVPGTSIIVDVATMTKPAAEGRVQLVRWNGSRPEGCRGTNHELYGMMQRPPYYGSVVAKRVRDDVADPTMLKCLVYSKAAHVFKATLKPGRLDQPRKNKFLRLAEPYFGKLERAFVAQQATMGDVRTEIRFRVSSYGEIPAVFSRLFAGVWGCLDIIEIDVDQVLRTQQATLEWARDNNLFVARDALRVSRFQYAVFNILLNAFGVWNRFMLTLRAKLILVGVRFSEVAAADQDEEMKEGNAGDDSDTEPEVDLTMDELDGNDSDTTETDFDNLFIDVMENVVVAQATNGGMLLVRDHMGVFVTRQRSREQVADVLIARYGAAWRDFVPHTQ